MASVAYVSVRAGPSRIHGQGLFAAAFIPKGSVIGPGLRRVASQGLEEDLEQTFITRHVNHALPANVTFGVSRAPGITYDLVALRDIQPGQEVVADYNAYGEFVRKTAALERKKGSRVRTAFVETWVVGSVDDNFGEKDMFRDADGNTMHNPFYESDGRGPTQDPIATHGGEVDLFLARHPNAKADLEDSVDLAYFRPKGSSVRTILLGQTDSDDGQKHWYHLSMSFSSVKRAEMIRPAVRDVIELIDGVWMMNPDLPQVPGMGKFDFYATREVSELVREKMHELSSGKSSITAWSLVQTPDGDPPRGSPIRTILERGYHAAPPDLTLWNFVDYEKNPPHSDYRVDGWTPSKIWSFEGPPRVRVLEVRVNVRRKNASGQFLSTRETRYRVELEDPDAKSGFGKWMNITTHRRPQLRPSGPRNSISSDELFVSVTKATVQAMLASEHWVSARRRPR
jgi:hypothetical protein